MSMEMFVLSESRLASIQDWQRSIDLTGHKVRLSTARPLAQLRGVIPVVLGENSAAYFECDLWDVGDIVQTYPEVHFDRRYKAAIAFRWGADVEAAYSAYIAAAGYARAAHGIIFDCQEGKIISPQQAIDTAEQMRLAKFKIGAAVRAVLKQMMIEAKIS
jgi:hypothetical protein